ncbi:MAG: hypothetical protein RL757_226 [Bacteroidota bacterium]|jgi:hypothetical protein
MKNTLFLGYGFLVFGKAFATYKVIRWLKYISTFRQNLTKRKDFTTIKNLYQYFLF